MVGVSIIEKVQTILALPVAECLFPGQIPRNSIQQGQPESQGAKGVTSSGGEEQKEGEGSWAGCVRGGCVRDVWL